MSFYIILLTLILATPLAASPLNPIAGDYALLQKPLSLQLSTDAIEGLYQYEERGMLSYETNVSGGSFDFRLHLSRQGLYLGLEASRELILSEIEVSTYFGDQVRKIQQKAERRTFSEGLLVGAFGGPFTWRSAFYLKETQRWQKSGQGPRRRGDAVYYESFHELYVRLADMVLLGNYRPAVQIEEDYLSIQRETRQSMGLRYQWQEYIFAVKGERQLLAALDSSSDDGLEYQASVEWQGQDQSLGIQFAQKSSHYQEVEDINLSNLGVSEFGFWYSVREEDGRISLGTRIRRFDFENQNYQIRYHPFNFTLKFSYPY